MTRTLPDRNALQRAISGDVILPDSPAYKAARKPAIARFHGEMTRISIAPE